MANTIYDFSESDYVSHYLFRGNGEHRTLKVADMETEVSLRFSEKQFLYFLQNLIDEHCFYVDQNGYVSVIESIKNVMKY